MTSLFLTFEKLAPILLTIFIAVFLLILLARLLLSVLLNQALKHYRKLRSSDKKNYQQPKKFHKEDEEMFRSKREIPRANSAIKAEIQAKKKEQKESGSYEIIPSQEQNSELGEINIVDFVKPIGFWTSMILGQKLTYLIQSAQILNKRGNKGFWASMIEAKEREAGRQHSRGR